MRFNTDNWAASYFGLETVHVETLWTIADICNAYNFNVIETAQLLIKKTRKKPHISLKSS